MLRMKIVDYMIVIIQGDNLRVSIKGNDIWRTIACTGRKKAGEKFGC